MRFGLENRDELIRLCITPIFSGFLAGPLAFIGHFRVFLDASLQSFVAAEIDNLARLILIENPEHGVRRAIEGGSIGGRRHIHRPSPFAAVGVEG